MKKLYLGYSVLFFITLIIEFFFYLKFNSTLFGLIYIIMNFIVALFLILSSINYKTNNSNLRISKNIFAIFIILILLLILPKINYIDESKEFVSGMKIFINVIKPILVVFLAFLSILDFKFNNKRNYKIN